MSHASEHKKDVNGRLTDANAAADMEALRSNFMELKSDVSRILGHLADTGKTGKQIASGQAHRAMDSAKEKVHDAVDTVKDRAHDAQEYGQDALDNLTKQIRANPGTATLIAFGVGFVASRLLLSRR